MPRFAAFELSGGRCSVSVVPGGINESGEQIVTISGALPQSGSSSAAELRWVIRDSLKYFLFFEDAKSRKVADLVTLGRTL